MQDNIGAICLSGIFSFDPQLPGEFPLIKDFRRIGLRNKTESPGIGQRAFVLASIFIFQGQGKKRFPSCVML